MSQLAAHSRRTAKKNTPLRDGGEEHKRMSPEEERSLTNSRRLHMPEFALSFIFRRESRRGWWPETRPQLALLLLYCGRSQALGGHRRSCDSAVGAPRHLGGARTALNGAGFEPGPARLLEGGASAGKGAERLSSGMGGVQDAGSRHLSLFWVLMVVFLCIFAFGASGFDSFLYQKPSNFIFFT